MKFIKGLLIFFLLVIIVGGVSFLAYSIYSGNMPFGGNMNMSSTNTQDNSSNINKNNNSSDKMDMSDMNNSSDNNQTVAIPNPQDAKNIEKFTEAVSLINKALEQITIDPYANATVSNSSSMNNNQMTQGTGTINIYPSGNSSVNLTPNSTTQDTKGAKSTRSGMNITDNEQNSQNTNYVYDQIKLQQLHAGIYTIAQGVLELNELNDSLLNQSMALEQQPLTYQTYVLRYNKISKNKTDLDNVIKLLDSASVLINVNPYASDYGYEIDRDSMKQLNEGVYKYAQGMALLQSLKKDLVSQMADASQNAQSMIYNSGMSNMNMGGISSFIGNISVNSIFNIILGILIIGLIIGILGSVLSLFKNKPQNNS